MSGWLDPDAGDIVCRSDIVDRWERVRGSTILGSILGHGVGAQIATTERTWRIGSYGKGWRWAALGPGGEPAAWLNGGALGFGSARIVIAPDREYAMKVSRRARDSARLLGDDGVLGTMRTGGRICIQPVSEPVPSTDASLVVLLACLYAVTQLVAPGFDAGGGGP